MEFEISITATKNDYLSAYVEADSEAAALALVQNALDAADGPICDVTRLRIAGKDVEVLHQEWTDEFELEATRLKGVAV